MTTMHKSKDHSTLEYYYCLGALRGLVQRMTDPSFVVGITQLREDMKSISANLDRLEAAVAGLIDNPIVTVSPDEPMF